MRNTRSDSSSLGSRGIEQGISMPHMTSSRRIFEIEIRIQTLDHPRRSALVAQHGVLPSLVGGHCLAAKYAFVEFLYASQDNAPSPGVLSWEKLSKSQGT